MDALDFVVEKRHAHRCLGVFRRENIQHITPHAEYAAPELEIVTLVLHLGEPLDRIALRELLALAQMQNHSVILPRIADTVDA